MIWIIRNIMIRSNGLIFKIMRDTRNRLLLTEIRILLVQVLVNPCEVRRCRVRIRFPKSCFRLGNWTNRVHSQWWLCFLVSYQPLLLQKRCIIIDFFALSVSNLRVCSWRCCLVNESLVHVERSHWSCCLRFSFDMSFAVCVF